MSDPTGEPGVPAENHPTSIPAASDKSVAKEVEKRVPKLVDLTRTPDKIILRLNKYAASQLCVGAQRESCPEY